MINTVTNTFSMGFLNALLKILAALIGLPLSLGGLIGFFYGLFMIFAENENSETGGIIVIISILSLSLGTIMGKFSRGDYD